MKTSDYEKLEAIHFLILEYLDNDQDNCDSLTSCLFLIEEMREPYLKERGI